MPTTISPAELPTRIQKLLEERQHYVDALARIDRTLASVGDVLGGAAQPKVKPAAMKVLTAKVKVRPKPGKFSLSGEASILNFIKQKKNPTTQDIKKHWEGEGRGGRADNTLSMMVKARKLKRSPIGKGVPGSRYSLD